VRAPLPPGLFGRVDRFTASENPTLRTRHRALRSCARGALLVAAGAIGVPTGGVVLSGIVSTAALAAGECGPIPAGSDATVDCTGLTITNGVEYAPASSNETFTLNIGDGTGAGATMVTAPPVQGFGFGPFWAQPGVLVSKFTTIGGVVAATGGVEASSIVNVRKHSQVSGSSFGVGVWTDGTGNDATINNYGTVGTNGTGKDALGIGILAVAGNPLGSPSGSGDAFVNNYGSADGPNVGIDAWSANGDASVVNANRASVTSSNGIGISTADPLFGGFGTAGVVTVQNAGSVDAYSTGIFAISSAKDVTVDGVAGDYGRVTASEGPGIIAVTSGAGNVTIDSGKVTAGSDGVLVSALTSNLITLAGGGVLGAANGSGNVNITTHDVTKTSGFYGVAGLAISGAATVTLDGNVKGDDSALPTIGAASIVLGTSGDNASTINLRGDNKVNASAVGLFATNGGDGASIVNANADSKVTSDALGIVGLGTGDGDVTVDAGQVHVKGGSYAIDALGIPLSGGVLGASLGEGAVTVNVNGEITADPGTLFGAFAYSAEGSATLNVNATIDPAIIGGGAITGGSGPANANYNSLVQGTLIGLLAGNLGTGDVNVNLGVPGSIQTDGIGILAFKVGDGNVGVRVNGAIGGLTNPAGPTGDDGVNVDYGFGDGNIRVHSGQYGTINAGDDGVEVNRLGGEGDIRVSLNADVTAKDNGVSILNIGTEGLTKVNIGRKDPMTIDAKNGDGIHILNFGTDGDTKVTVHGGSKVIAKDGSAIGIVSTSLGLGGDHDVIVKNDGLLVGKGGLFSPTVGVITDTDFDFTNQSDGRITTAGHDPSASIFGTLAGGDIDIANYGSMRGSMQLASLFGAIDITNDHRWTTSGFNEFAALCDILIENNDLIRTKGLTVFHFDSLLGQSTVANNDVLKVRDDGSTPGVVFFKGLDEFDNGYGVIDMQNGKSEYAGNPFHVMPVYGTGIGNAVFMSGNFDGGAYSSLYVDTALRGPSDSSSDLLVVKTINQGAYGGGSTTLYVNDTAWNLPGEYVPDGIPVVGVLDGTTTNIGDFTLAGGPIDKGLFTYDLFLDKTPLFQPTSNAAAWVLASYPDSSATALAQSLNIINNMWDTTAGGWIDRSGDLRGIYGTGGGGGSDLALPGASKTGDNANGVWARAIGNWGSRNDSSTIQPFANQPVTVAADYDESLWAIQGGADHAFQAGRGTVVVGLMGGYEANSVDFSSPGDSASYTAPMAGIYASYIDGPAYVDALFKADFLKADLNIGGDTASTDGTALGGRIETGYRYKMKGGWFFEPTASLSYVNTELDSTTLSGTPVTFNDADSLRGEIGFRSGGAFASGNLLYQPYLTASLGNEFLGDNSVFLASGPGVTVADDVRGLYGKAGAGINVTNLRRNVTTYLQGTYMFSDDYQSGSAKGGIRINW
jgi:outer membrane autotransporter protein